MIATCSVTRFVGIFKSLVKKFRRLFNNWRNFEPTYFARFLILLVKFKLLQMPKIQQTTWPSDHT